MPHDEDSEIARTLWETIAFRGILCSSRDQLWNTSMRSRGWPEKCIIVPLTDEVERVLGDYGMEKLRSNIGTPYE